MLKTKICPQCGKKMIKRYENYDLPSYPPQYPWYWWCKCGYTEPGGIDKGTTAEELYEKLWEEANKPKQAGMKTICLAIVGKHKTDLIIEKDCEKWQELQKSFPDGEFYCIYTVQGDVGDLVELALKTYENRAAINARISREAGILGVSMNKQKKLKYARIVLNRNVLDITNVDGKPTHPENTLYLGKSKDIQQAVIEFINKWFAKPVVIEIWKYSEWEERK